MNLAKLNTYSFKVTSYIPILWISSLYLFLMSYIMGLGKYPVPSLNDPKDNGFGFLYTIAAFGIFVFFYGSILWIINLIIGIYLKNISKKNVFLFIIGLFLCLIQIIFDPGQVLYWFLD